MKTERGEKRRLHRAMKRAQRRVKSKIRKRMIELSNDKQIMAEIDKEISEMKSTEDYINYVTNNAKVELGQMANRSFKP